VDALGRFARDTAYVMVGFGVLGFQRAQVRRREVLKRVEEVRSDVEDFLGQTHRTRPTDRAV
jgi:hypothetical protein